MLPGGAFHGASLKEFSSLCRQMYGDLYKMPGMFGMKNILVSYNPYHFEKVLRTEGIWPIRRNSESINYFRNHIKKDFYKEIKGLLNS